ncbi:MgtC/SapB family protein [Brevibacillus fluminis]|uniref:MgtC/SapB family protein n=1 Tax=Brevibacillus fluminis TaxID=511487 RepID=A0A3M8DU82_9BACL|nr:MgtC/SapB family protein [Brevibacillus fluminis]RNB91738.1 MgtC/SapB family protein [Brevibacillus fluminis]
MEYLTLMYEQHVIANLEMYLRVLISAVLGLFIGWDRSFRHKPAGLKTYTYVSVACTLITLVSIYSAKVYAMPNVGTQMDPMRLAAQIVTGLGFLGAGVILKDGLQVKGLTSAAMIFFAGGVGIGIGAGFYGIVIFSVLVTFLCARFSSRFEEKSLRRTAEHPHAHTAHEAFHETHSYKEHG